MRSFIKRASGVGIQAVVDQQFEVADEIVAAGLMPIIEPEVDIHSPEKAAAEAMLKAAIVEQLAQLRRRDYVMLKLSLPDVDDFYARPGKPPEGPARRRAVRRLRPERGRRPPGRNHGVIASFSRALTEGLSVDQSDDEFDATLRHSIESILEASLS